MAPRSDSSKQTSRIILMVAGLLVLTSMGYFAYQYFSEKEENKENTIEIEELNTEIFELEEKIYDFEVMLEDRKLDLATKNRELEQKKEELRAMAARLQQARQSDKANLGKIKQLEQRVGILTRLVEQYEEEIDELRQANELLAGQVDSLQANEGRLLNRNQSLLQEKDAALQELKQTQELASVLKTKDFAFFNVRRRRVHQDTVFRRWGMKDLRVCFTVMENPLAESGPLDLYLVYEGPEGSVYQSASDGGSFSYDGQLRQYTAMQSIDYQQSSQEVCIEYRAPEDFKYEKGPQYISIYTQENLIGQGSFEIK